MVTINNELLTVTVNPKGAELTSVVNKQTGLEYMWGGDPAVWGKHSPVLFPIVGTLKENTYLWKKDKYSLSRHGFARDKVFVIEEQKPDEVIFTLVQDKETQLVYPFNFRLRIKYSLLGNTISVSYEVKNTGNGELLFSLGAHPAFKVPLVDKTSYGDYYFEFEKEETANRWPISKDGLIENQSVPVLEGTNKLPITRGLFSQDALVFKSLKSTAVSIRSNKTEHGLKLSFPGFPYLGLWAAKGGDFVCIEPWCGIADATDADQVLEHKEGVNSLVKGDSFARTWVLEVF
ncbi:MAG: aldose 1-epimerase family protein [Flavitalea sp.]